MSLLRKLFGPSKAEVWQELSRQIGARYLHEDFWRGDSVEARVGPWRITLDTYTVSTGRSTITFTRLRAPYVNRDGFRFNAYRAGLFSELGKAFGMQDVTVGDPEFDNAFIVKSADEAQARALLADEKLRELLLRQPAISLEVVDDEGFFGPEFGENVDELRFHTVGIIKDIERLKALFDLFAETLHQLCNIGSAYETDPDRPAHVPPRDSLLRAAEAAPGDTLLRPAGGASAPEDPGRLLRPTESDGAARPE